MKPIIKWVGGKTQILDKVLQEFPRKIENYHELFIGGGSVLLGILEDNEIEITGNICAYDLNAKLINMYKQVQTKPSELHDELVKLFETYDGIKGVEVNRSPKNEEESLSSKESFYYWIRSIYNKTIASTHIHAAMLIFLNKTCFRGVYREGPNGFNVPYGHYKTTPSVVSLEELLKYQRIFERVVFRTIDFRDVFLKHIETGDFVYADPPYAPEGINSFVSYTSDGFKIDEHMALFNLLKTSEINFVMSNAKVHLVLEAFENYKIVDVPARRAINSKNPGASTMEVLISSTLMFFTT